MSFQEQSKIRKNLQGTLSGLPTQKETKDTELIFPSSVYVCVRDRNRQTDRHRGKAFKYGEREKGRGRQKERKRQSFL